MAALPRSVSLAVFRAHIENGLSVGIGVGLTGLAVGFTMGLPAAIAAATGAICVSISDRTDPLRQKIWIMSFAFLSACFFTALSSFSRFSPPVFIAAVAFTGLWCGLISAYGKWVMSLAMTCVLAFVFAMGEYFPTVSDAADHLMLFICGALTYTTYAVMVAWLFDDRGRRLLLAEAMRAFADYLRAKAALYNPDTEGTAAFRALIDAHAALADRLQTARDSLFSRRWYRMQLKRIDTLIALLDAFETVLSSDADFETLRNAPQRDLLWRLNGFVHQMADEIEHLTLALRFRHGHAAPLRHAEESRQLLEMVSTAQDAAPNDPVIHAFAATANKLVLADTYVAALATALDNATPPSTVAAGLDLDLFRQDGPRGLGLLLRQFRWRAPAFRYAVRLSLAMTAGLMLTIAFPRFAQANWVLLTIALIMRANYSVTRQRRWDRVTGTLIGCALAVTFINTLPAPMLLLLILLAVGTSHAYGLVAYRITAIGASISALLLLHFVDPSVNAQFFERIVDTLIGAGLSWAFSHLLPNWERDDLPRTVRGLLAADAAFADAALRLEHGRQRYRLASDLSSMPVLVKLHAPELDKPSAEAAIAQVRERVVSLLQPDAAQDNPNGDVSQRGGFADLHGSGAMEVLARRLAHIEQAARKVARLARRPVIEAV